MSRLEELINELCPDGVEYKKINEIAPYVRGKGLSKTAINSGEIPIILYGELYTTYGDYIEKIVSKASKEFTDKSRLINKGSVVIPVSSTTKEAQIGKASVLNVDEVYLGGDAVAFCPTDVVIPEFLMYVMNSKSFEKKKMKCVKGTTIQHLSPDEIASIEVPLPPLSIQSEIVHILDSFTLLTAELTAELTARQKQYAFYRDYLLDFSNEDVTKKIPDIDCSNVEFKKLGEVCNVQSGGTPSKKESEYWNGGTIPWLASTVCKNKKSVEEVTDYITEKGLKNSSAKMMKEKTTLIALVGATIGKIAFLPFEASINQNVAGLFPIDENIVNADYLFYACSTLYSKFQNLGNGKLAMANMSFVRNLVIPVPPLSVQENIVKILDRFDKLNNDMSEGLPAEIEARKKQYEYYRDTLLSFDDKACSHIVKVERERERANTH